MNLETLAETIETLKERIGQHRQELSENETRTRAALINPLLHALGWDVSDPALVKLEYNVGRQRADYALMNHDGKPAAVFEAKKLGESLDDHQIQTLNYANREGVGYAGLTDGDRWELYSVFEQAPLKERRRLINISIVEDEPRQCALKLLTLWRPNLASDQPLTPILEPPPPDGWTPLPECKPPRNAPPPSAMRLPDGKEIGIRFWNDILVEIAGWLHEQGRLTSDKAPILSKSKKRFIANSEPKSLKGIPMERPIQIAEGIYVERANSRYRIPTDPILLFERCGVDPSKTLLRAADKTESADEGDN